MRRVLLIVVRLVDQNDMCMRQVSIIIFKLPKQSLVTNDQISV